MHTSMPLQLLCDNAKQPVSITHGIGHGPWWNEYSASDLMDLASKSNILSLNNFFKKLKDCRLLAHC